MIAVISERHFVRIGSCQRFGRRQRSSRQLVQSNAIARDVGPKIFAARQTLIHLFERVDDHIDGSRDGRVTLDFVFGDVPIFGDVGQILVADDHQEI